MPEKHNRKEVKGAKSLAAGLKQKGHSDNAKPKSLFSQLKGGGKSKKGGLHIDGVHDAKTDINIPSVKELSKKVVKKKK